MKSEDDELDASLKRALHREPGDAYFESFASRVTERIAAEARAEAARAAGARAPWWRRLFDSPRALATAGSVAVLAVALGVTVVMMRQGGEGPASVVASKDEAAPRSAAGSASLETQAPEPAAPAPEQTVVPSSRPATGREDDALAKSVPAPQGAGAVTNALPDRDMAATPQRVQELRTTESGEQVPVTTDRRGRLAEREAAPAPRTPGELKRESVAPMTQAAPPPAAMSPAAPAPTAPARPQGEAGGRVATRSRSSDAPAQPAPVVEEKARDEAATSETRSGRARPAAIGEAEAPALDAAARESAPTSLAPGAISSLESTGKALFRADAAGPKGSPFAAEAPALQARVEDASAKTAAARRARTAFAWDEAARAWQSLSGDLASPTARIEGLHRAADARLRAWRVEPTPAREAAAGDAARAFEAAAPRDGRVRALMAPALPWGRGR